jgi:BirA family transcriptional regulator, biotin operon repressor / biotin---[acetyl-CoA-carboxylase] ligase
MNLRVPIPIDLPSAYRLVRLERVGSTNDEAKRLARGGADDHTLVWALEQTAGRGRRGRVWASPPGNLYVSLVLRPDAPPAQAAQLSFAAALGLGEAITALVPPLVELRYKWPNDVLLNGRKIAGILLESESGRDGGLDWLVLGVGVNITSHPPETERPATSLRDEGAGAATPELVLEGFARSLLVWTNRWLEGGFGPIRAAWLRRASGVGEMIRVRLDREELVGRFAELDHDGALLLDTAAGRRRVTAGDVFLGSG